MHENVAGLAELEAQPNGDVGIVVSGLVPEFVGKGFGGAFLTVATRRAWNMETCGRPTTRVWLQTSSRDHPHAQLRTARFSYFPQEGGPGSPR